MNNAKITQIFNDLKKTGKKAFIPYITAGDPNLEKTLEALAFFANNGADMIELGVPFSDPMVDGVVIQRAMERSLRNNTTLKKILQTVKSFKSLYSTPIILMGYYNPFWAYDIKKFAEDAHYAGVDAVLTVDLQPEEAKPFLDLLQINNIISIFLASTVTDERRIKIIKKFAEGFIYFVSVCGVTGERKILPSNIKGKIKNIMNEIELPVALGFGISNPESIERFYSHADGFIVGSSLVKKWEAACLSSDEMMHFQTFFKKLADACHGQ